MQRRTNKVHSLSASRRFRVKNPTSDPLTRRGYSERVKEGLYFFMYSAFPSQNGIMKPLDDITGAIVDSAKKINMELVWCFVLGGSYD